MSVRENMFNYFEFFCANTSTHGGNWLSKIHSGGGKVLFLILLTLMQITMVALFTRSLFSENKDIYTMTEWDTSANKQYPNITVCNPRMFDRQKVQGKTVGSHRLASYKLVLQSQHRDHFGCKMIPKNPPSPNSVCFAQRLPKPT